MLNVLKITDDASVEGILARLSPAGQDSEAGRSLESKAEAVRAIVDDVRKRGDGALAEFTERFDGVALRPDEFELTAAQMDESISKVDKRLVAALERAHGNIRTFHAKHLRQSWEEVTEDGMVLGQRITPIERVGVYVPGGKAFYPSSVLMNIVPACVAGVKEIVMVSPPSFEGSIHPAVLAAARIAGATRVFRIGGAQAVAALAYGTARVPAVLKITGPGNTYVTVAKRLVRSACDIDTEAGPSEVVVIADDKANPEFVAAELLAQAEHDEEARSIAIVLSVKMAESVKVAVEAQAARLPRKKIIIRSLTGQGYIVVARDLDEAARVADWLAPEHLSIQTEVPRKVFEKVQNAGAAMLGGLTSVAFGDYYAGPNHILPTGRRARFASPLTAEDFRKVTSVLSYTKERLLKDADDVIQLAEAEELTAHARAVEMRK
jgi:histidinol dehydrogenase